MILSAKHIVAYFQYHHGIRKHSNHWYAFECTFCNDGKKKMAVNPHYENVKCFKCGYSDNVTNYVMGDQGLSYGQAKRYVLNLDIDHIKLSMLDNTNGSTHKVTLIDLPKGFIPLNQGDGVLSDRARKYITDRGLNLSLLTKMGVGYVKTSNEDDPDEDYFGRIIIPFKRRGRLIYYVGRDFLGTQYLRYKNPKESVVGIGKSQLLYNEDALFQYDDVWLFEGWSDALTVGQNATASLGWKLSPTQIHKLRGGNYKNLIYVPDAGKLPNGSLVYHQAINQAAQLIDYKRIKILDLNPFGKNMDANKLGLSKLLSVEQKTPYLDSMSDVIKLRYV